MTNTALIRPFVCVAMAAMACHDVSTHAASVAFPATLPPSYQSSNAGRTSRTHKKGSGGGRSPNSPSSDYDGSSDDSDGGIDEPDSAVFPEEESSSSDFNDMPPPVDETERTPGRIGAFGSRDDNVMGMRAGGAHDDSASGDGESADPSSEKVSQDADEAPALSKADTASDSSSQRVSLGADDMPASVKAESVSDASSNGVSQCADEWPAPAKVGTASHKESKSKSLPHVSDASSNGVSQRADDGPAPAKVGIASHKESKSKPLPQATSGPTEAAPLEAGEHTTQSRPLKTLKKLQAILDDTDYATSASSGGSNPPAEVSAIETSEDAGMLASSESVGVTADSGGPHGEQPEEMTTAAVVDEKPAGPHSKQEHGSSEKLWTSKDRSKYKRQRRLRHERERREKEQLEIQRKRWHREQMALYDADHSDGTEATDATDASDDSLGDLSNLPVYLSDSEGNSDEFDIETPREASPSSPTQQRQTAPRGTSDEEHHHQHRQKQHPQQQQQQQQQTPQQTQGNQYQYQYPPPVSYGYHHNPDGQQGQYPQQPPPMQYQPGGYPYPPYGSGPNAPHPYSQQQQQQYAAQYAAWAAAYGAMPPPPMNPAAAGYPNYPPRPLAQGPFPPHGFVPQPFASPPSGTAGQSAASKVFSRSKTLTPNSQNQVPPVETKPVDQQSVPASPSGVDSPFAEPGPFQGQALDMMQKQISLAEASTMITFDSIQKLSFLVMGVVLLCYCAVSPRTLPIVEYNMRFKENAQIVSLVLIAPVFTALSVFDAKESDINKLISAFSTAFTVGYVASFVLEVIFTTFLRLAVFSAWEPAIFKLTPEVPTIILPWVLRENRYRPKRITLFAADFATSCLAAPFVEEFIKLKVVQLCVRLPRNYKRSKKKSTSGKKSKKRKSRKRSLERIERGPGECDVTNINSYVTTMLAASVGLKLADSTRRILMYTKRTDANKSFYAFVRGVFPIHELCATMTALDLAKRDVLGVDMPLWRILLPAVFIHGMANFRGMKPIFKWNSSTPWSEMQLSPWNVADDSTFGQLLNKGFAKLMWIVILGRVLGYCIKNYYMVGRQAVKRTTTYAGKQAAFSAELAAAQMLKKTKKD